MDDVYIMGGSLRGDTSSCVKFNVKDKNWKKVAKMKERRRMAACSVFEGRIVVSGGINYGIFLNTVEAYDHVADAWSNMPNMIESRYDHKSVAVKNKLFVVGGERSRNSEVFDSTCNKFVSLKPPPESFIKYLRCPAEVISIGNRLVVFLETGTILLYDFVNNEWSLKPCEVTKNIERYSCAKLPQF